MSQIAKTAAVPQTAPTTRAGAGYRTIADSQSAPIEESSAGQGAFFRSADFLFDAYGQRKDEQQQERKQQPLQQPGLFSTPSSSFAAVFEAQPVEIDPGDGEDLTPGRTVKFVLPTNRIIDTYETNARVISGNNTFRGQNISFNL
ncbi:MAG: hypothetical protein ACPGOV_09455 [Magnetovibrionaceae bacterium]